MTKKSISHECFGIFICGIKQKEEDETLPMSDNKVGTWNDSVEHRLHRQKKEKNRERQKGETEKSELPQKSSREPFSRMKKPHRKSVNLKDHDQLGKRNREKRSLRERLSVANLHRIRSLIKKYVVSKSFRNSLYMIRSHGSFYFITRYYRPLICVQKKNTRLAVF